MQVNYHGSIIVTVFISINFVATFILYHELAWQCWLLSEFLTKIQVTLQVIFLVFFMLAVLNDFFKKKDGGFWFCLLVRSPVKICLFKFNSKNT